MKKYLLLLTLVSSSLFADCSPMRPQEEFLRENDFPWNQTLEEIGILSDKLYQSDKRLWNRAYKTKNGFVIPVDVQGKLKEVRITETFINSVRLHIEEALKRRYVDFINFSDMGHSHFFIEQKYYDQVIDKVPLEKKELLYEKILSFPELKILYHTAEQLVMKDEAGNLVEDRHIQWRFFTRNLVGDNKARGKMELLHNREHKYNTANDYDEGYRYWGGGFHLSANKNGCFTFSHKGKSYNFDLALEGW